MLNYYINPAHAPMIGAQAADFINTMRMMGADKNAYGVYGEDSKETDGQYIVKDGIAVILVKGALVSSLLSGCYGAMTYEQLTEKVEHAVHNPAVDKILIRFHSPGGTVTGCAEAAHKIDLLSSQKEIWAHCTMADSAAYWLASATNRIILDPTGEVGSIGVIMTHVDFSKMLEEFGIQVTHIYSGSHKADGSPYKELSDTAKERYQADVDILRTQFVEKVSSYRGLDEKTVLGTEAKTFQGQNALDAGLCDDIAFYGDVFELMQILHVQNNSNQTMNDRKDSKMGKQKFSETDATKTEAKDKASDNEEEEPEDGSDQEQGSDDEGADAKAAERNRISAILGCEEAKGRETLAQSLALHSSITPDEAKKHLAASPKSQTETQPVNALATAMEEVDNPQISNESEPEKEANPLIAAQKKFNPSALNK